MEENKTKETALLFDIFDYQYINILIFVSIGLIGMLIWLNMDFVHKTLNKNMVEMISIAISVSLIFRLVELYIDKKSFFLNFYANRLVRSKYPLEIDIDKNTEIYKVSTLWYMSHRNIKRPTTTIKLVAYLGAVIMIPLLLLMNLCLAIYYKKFLIQEVLVVIGKNDKEVIVISIPRNDIEKQKQLREYFLEYANVDIEQLKTLQFIPRKEEN